MDRRTVVLGLGVTALGLWQSPLLAAPKIAVIVHPKNPVRSLALDEIESIFKALRRSWLGGKRILPFNFPPRDPTRVAFDLAALHMDPGLVARYWIDQRVRGGQHAPTQVPSSAMMIQVVSNLEASIGYVPKNDATNGVRIVAEV
jgi:ABC-type phosphate transport system substrate-binding protein